MQCKCILLLYCASLYNDTPSCDTESKRTSLFVHVLQPIFQHKNSGNRSCAKANLILADQGDIYVILSLRQHRYNGNCTEEGLRRWLAKSLLNPGPAAIWGNQDSNIKKKSKVNHIYLRNMCPFLPTLIKVFGNLTAWQLVSIGYLMCLCENCRSSLT